MLVVRTHISFLFSFNLFFVIEECLDKTMDLFYLNILFDNSLPLISIISSDKTINNTRVPAKKRIGPHNKETLSIFFGSLLGDCHAEYRSKGQGTRFCFYQKDTHASYLLWLHDLISNLGYCNPNKPKLQTRLVKKGKTRKILRFKTWTYSNLNWVQEIWYKDKIKIVPDIISDYLTPLALAIWIMVDGSKVNKGLKLCTNCFTYTECLFLTKILFENFNLKSSVQSAGKFNQYHIYIWSESMPLLRLIVLPYVHSSMKYKLGL